MRQDPVLGIFALDRVFRRIADQPAWITQLVHHLVAAVDARGAAYAFVLHALADVDPGRTYLHADVAVDAVAQARRPVICRPAARAARLAPLRVVGDDQRIGIEHHALEARIRAHVHAH